MIEKIDENLKNKAIEEAKLQKKRT